MSPTPILDRVAPMPAVNPGTSRDVRWAALLVGTGTFCATVLVGQALQGGASRPPWNHELFQWLFPGGPTFGRALSIGGSLLTAALLAVALHELGHLLGGLCAGFRFNQLRIGPLYVDHPGRISFRRSPGSGALGWVIMSPTHAVRLRARAALLVLCGPGVNFACAAVLLAWPGPRGLFSSTFLFVSLATGVLALLPVRQRVTVSDGRRLWLLFRDPAGSRRWLALMRLGAELRAGVLPESRSEDALAEALAPRDESPDAVAANAFGYSSAFHRHRDVDAARYLERSLQLSRSAAPALRCALMSDAGIFQARRRKRPDLAEQWLADMPATSCPGWLRTRVEAGIREARGDFGGALEKLDELEREHCALPDRAVRGMQMQLLERWRSELRRATASAS